MSIVGIIGAMDEEITALKGRMEVVSVQNIVGVDFHMGTMGGKSVALVCSGIGKVNAAICAQVLIDHYAVDYIINVGVAGALQDLRIGDIVVSGDAVQHDVDCTLFGHEPGVIPRLGVATFKADDRLVKLTIDTAHDLYPDKVAIAGRIASGDRFISKAEEKERIVKLFGAQCVEMEGAAIAQTCWLNKIPFVIIRGISDTADDQTTVSFDEFVVETADVSGNLVAAIVEKI